MVCGKCGNQVMSDSRFCEFCGNPLTAPTVYSSPEIRKEKKVWPLIVIPAIAVCIAAAAIYIFVFSGLFENKEEDDITVTNEPSITERVTEIADDESLTGVMETEKPIEKSTAKLGETRSVNTNDLYIPSLAYKRMGDIGNTTMTDDETFYEIRNVITQFDADCEAYINGTGEVPAQLRPGSTAYDQQTGFKTKHPTLIQRYDAIDVLSTRGGDEYFYAWVTETLYMNENGSTKTETSHWVYKLSRTGLTWYIDDYTSDPAYK